ncbi:MAG: HIT domain-containing protein [Pseudomonadota bacterium]
MSEKENFILDPRLAADTIFVGNLQLCRVLLCNDARFPWIILVPQRARISEIIDLNENDQQVLMQEIAQVSEAMRVLLKPDKLNVASLGNIVPQLHVHVIARFKEDAAWPNPVWGCGEAQNYHEDIQSRLVSKLRTGLGQAI